MSDPTGGGENLIDVQIRVSATGTGVPGAVGAELRGMGQAANSVTSPLRGATRGLGELARGGEGAVMGLGRIERTMSTVAIASAGISGPLGRVTEAGVLLGSRMGGLQQPVLAAAAGIAAFALVTQNMQAPIDAATKANEQLAESFGRVEARGRPAVAVMQQLQTTQQTMQAVVDQGPSFIERAATFLDRMAGYKEGDPHAIATDMKERRRIAEETARASGRNALAAITGERNQVLGETLVKSFGEGISRAADNLENVAQLRALRASALRTLGTYGLTPEDFARMAKAINDGFAKALETESRAGALSDLRFAAHTLTAPALRVGTGFHPTSFSGAPQFDLTTAGSASFGAAALHRISGDTRLTTGQVSAAEGLANKGASPLARYQQGLETLNAMYGPNGASANQEKYTAGLRALQEEYDAATKKTTEFSQSVLTLSGRMVSAAAHKDVFGALGAGLDLASAAAKRHRDKLLADPSADPKALAGATSTVSMLGTVTTVLGVVGGLSSLFGGLFGGHKQDITIAGYSPAALAQLRELTSIGQLVAVNTSGNVDWDTVSYMIGRQSRRDSTPRLPTTRPGPGA